MKKQKYKLESLGEFMVGGICHEDLLAQAGKVRNLVWSEWVETVLRSTSHLRTRFSVEVFANCLRIDLPKLRPGKNLRPMYEEAIENGYCLCPVSLAFEILLQRKVRGFVGEAILAMKPAWVPTTEPKVTQQELLTITDKKGKWSKTRSLHVTPACLDSFADGGSTYLLCRQNRHLVRAGLAKIDF